MLILFWYFSYKLRNFIPFAGEYIIQEVTPVLVESVKFRVGYRKLMYGTNCYFESLG